MNLSERQRLCLCGLPDDGSFAQRGSACYSTYVALQAKGLVKSRRDGNAFAWALVTPRTKPKTQREIDEDTALRDALRACREMRDELAFYVLCAIDPHRAKEPFPKAADALQRHADAVRKEKERG